MTSLLTDAQKASLQAVFTDVHDTFKRTLKAYKEGKKIVLSQNPGYNHIYKSQTQSTTIETIERDIEARIKYFNANGEEISNLDNVGAEATKVRLKIAPSDWDFLSTAERIVLDGHPYDIASPEIPHGLFGVGFYTIFLNRVN